MERKDLNNGFLGKVLGQTISTIVDGKVLVTLGLISFLVILISTGCGGSKSVKLDNLGLDNAPTTVKSVDDLPKMSTTPSEIAKTGVIRVIAESAPKQSHYNALTAARTVAQKRLLEHIVGNTIEGKTLVDEGLLTKEYVESVTQGHIRSFDCGAYYDRGNQVGYYCVEIPVGKRK